MPASHSQYRGTVGMFDNIFANKRRIISRNSYHKKIQSCKFSLIIILFTLLHAFSILIRFLKNIAWQSMLMVQINKRIILSYFYLFPSCSYTYIKFGYFRVCENISEHLSENTEKNPRSQKESLFSET